MPGSPVIQASVAGIEACAFENAGFGTLTLRSGLVGIGAMAFRSCAFTGTLTIPDSATGPGGCGPRF